MKRCPMCGLDLPVGEFYRNKAQPTGIAAQCKKCYAQMSRDRADARRRYVKKWKINNRQKVLAHKAVARAVASGRLPAVSGLVCAECPAEATAYHHQSYDAARRLDVIPLCPQCHANEGAQ